MQKTAINYLLLSLLLPLLQTRSEQLSLGSIRPARPDRSNKFSYDSKERKQSKSQTFSGSNTTSLAQDLLRFDRNKANRSKLGLKQVREETTNRRRIVRGKPVNKNGRPALKKNMVASSTDQDSFGLTQQVMKKNQTEKKRTSVVKEGVAENQSIRFNFWDEMAGYKCIRGRDERDKIISQLLDKPDKSAEEEIAARDLLERQALCKRQRERRMRKAVKMMILTHKS